MLPRWSYRFTWGRDQWTLAQDCGRRKEKTYYVLRTEMISIARGVSWRGEKNFDQLSLDRHFLPLKSAIRKGAAADPQPGETS